MDSTEKSNFELHLLILKFLRQGPCSEVAQFLEEELNKQSHNLLPKRLDWDGNPRDQTIKELERQYPHVRAEHLATLCSLLRLRPGTNHHSLLYLPFPRQPSPRIWQFPQITSHHQLTGVQHSLSVYTNMYQKCQLLRRNVGHMSCVYCILFDKTGQYVFTGSDDSLIKMWSTRNGRLCFTFRGASSEISDMAVSEDNRMLAAGCMDKIILVWSLQSAAPIAALKHGGAITAIHFCPSVLPEVPPYLVATSGDGCVTFWKFSVEEKMTNQVTFEPQPIRFNEKMRPGCSKMVCAAFSPGGLFLATGSEDHHVRVYMMDGKDGPTKILEEKAHTMRVDSIQWVNLPQLRFISGSKDGSARVWSYRNSKWSSIELKMTDEGKTNVHKKNESLRVTMVSVNSNDTKIITAGSDFSLGVWDLNTAVLITRLMGHKDEVYVLEPHPSMPEFLMSGGHDGNLIIWDISTNKMLFQYQNNIDGQGHAGIYDAKWSPDSLHVAASDSHGHVLFFGMSSKEPYENCPEELFFHTDYHPLIRDSFNYVLDEKTQCPPHLLPPPLLVDMEGNAYPSDIQKLVPGREHIPAKETISPGSGARFHQPTEQHPPREIAQFIIDDLIRNLSSFEESSDFSGREISDHTDLVIDNTTGPGSNVSSAGGTRPGSLGRGDFEGSTQRMGSPIVESIWRQRQLVPISKFKGAKDVYARREELGFQESELYKRESEKSGLLSNHSDCQNEYDKVSRGNKERGRKREARSSTPTSGITIEKRMRSELPRGNDENTLDSQTIDDKCDTSSLLPILSEERIANESKKEKSKPLPYMCPHCHHCYSKQSLVINHMKTCRFKT